MSLFFCVAPNFLFLSVNFHLDFTGDVESEAVVGLSKVAPPAELPSASLLCPAPLPCPPPLPLSARRGRGSPDDP